MGDENTALERRPLWAAREAGRGQSRVGRTGDGDDIDPDAILADQPPDVRRRLEMMAAAVEAGNWAKRQLARAPRGCILCGHRATVPGVWLPSPRDLKRLGVPKGESKAAAYALCRPCDEHPERDARVRRSVLAEARRQLSRVGAN